MLDICHPYHVSNFLHICVLSAGPCSTFDVYWLQYLRRAQRTEQIHLNPQRQLPQQKKPAEAQCAACNSSLVSTSPCPDLRQSTSMIDSADSFVHSSPAVTYKFMDNLSCCSGLFQSFVKNSMHLFLLCGEQRNFLHCFILCPGTTALNVVPLVEP